MILFHLSLFAQQTSPPPDTVSMILVGKEKQNDPDAITSDVTKSAQRDFFRRRKVYLLPLEQAPNHLLLSATLHPELSTPGEGLIDLLMGGLLRQEFEAEHPLNPDWDYTYTDLFWDMLAVSGLSEEEAFSLPMDSLPWQSLHTHLLLGIEEGMTHRGDEFHRLSFLGLVWDHDPQSGEPQLLCLIPVSRIKNLLKTTYCTWEGPDPNRPFQTSVWRWLESRQYRGYRINPEAPGVGLRPIPSEDHSQRAMPSWYKP